MGSLYRFISFPAFVNLVERRQERYVQPTLWEDTYEGYLIQLLSKRDVDECLTMLANSFCQGNYEMAVVNYMMQDGIVMGSAGQNLKKAMLYGVSIHMGKWLFELKRMRNKFARCFRRYLTLGKNY